VGILSSDKQRPSPEEQLRRQEEGKGALAGLQGPEQDTAADKTDLLQELSESDLLDSVDDPALRNLLTKDIPTSNFDEAEAAEFKAYVDIVLLKKEARLPHENQDVTGVLREWVHDDPAAGRAPVDKADVHEDEALGQAIKARVAKAKGGSLVRRVLSSIRHSIMQRESGDDDNGGRILDRLRGN